MSLKINKDNIFMINPKNGYFDDDNSDDQWLMILLFLLK
jgi:hypothetical protein